MQQQNKTDVKAFKLQVGESQLIGWYENIVVKTKVTRGADGGVGALK